MAVEIGGKVYRNLPEQVKKNQDDIEDLQGKLYTFEIAEEEPEDPDEKTIYLVWDEDTSCFLQFIWKAEDEQWYAIGMLPSVLPVVPEYNIENGSGANSLQQIGCSATGENSIALGNSTQAKANGAHAEGQETVANNSNSHAEGCRSKARNGAAHAEGTDTNAVGASSHAEGSGSYVYETGSSGHAEGVNTKVRSEGGHAEGYGSEVLAEAFAAHASGCNTKVKGYCGFVTGLDNTVLGDMGAAFGYGNSLGLDSSNYAGTNSIVAGYLCSIKESSSSLVGGSDSHLDDTTNPAYQSIVWGWGLKGSGINNKALFGRWNLNTSNALLEIGNGNSDNDRKCAFQVLENGTIRLPNYTSTALTTQNGYKTVAVVNGVLTVVGN